MNKLTTNEIVKISKIIWKAFGLKEMTINIGGLEPTIWKDYPNLTILDLIKILKISGFRVEMTTNGSNLIEYSRYLKDAGLSKLRISVHHFDKYLYYKITGKDNLNYVKRAIDNCIDSGLDLSINRVLLKGYTDDIPRLIKYTSERNITLKLYDLYWLPRISPQWKKYYLHWNEIVKSLVYPITKRMEKIDNKYHRIRNKFYLNRGGAVEVKEFHDSMHENFEICKNCYYKNKCKETFGSYIYIYPSKNVIFCNLREDLNINLNNLTREDLSTESTSNFIIENFEKLMGRDWINRIQSGKIVFYINDICNYNCSFPDESFKYENLWCFSCLRNFEITPANLLADSFIKKKLIHYH